MTLKGINSNGDAFSNAGVFVERNSTVPEVELQTEIGGQIS